MWKLHKGVEAGTRDKRRGGKLMSYDLSQVHTGVHSQAMRYLSNMMTAKVLVKKLFVMVLIMLLVFTSLDVFLTLTA